MNFLNHQLVHKRRLLTNGLLALVTGAAAVLWMSAGQVWAGEAPVAQFQTLRRPPTPAPTAPPPTPTPTPARQQQTAGATAHLHPDYARRKRTGARGGY
jgi:hypothetical protein